MSKPCPKSPDGQHTLAPESVERVGTDGVRIEGKCLDCGSPGVMIVGGHAVAFWSSEGEPTLSVEALPRISRSVP